ncbi:hypothetical protein IAT38_003630 [Cryptococcus sp. DSM 104549]
MADDILRNSAALNALKRHQLVSLSKKYGLRASGKNVEMVERLQEYAEHHAHDLDFYIPEPAPTPIQSLTPFSPASSAPSSPMPPPTHVPPGPQATLVPGRTLNHKESMMSTCSRRSDAWEVLSESDASMISPKKPEPAHESEGKYGSVGSWKSANNGEPLNEFGGDHHEEARSTSSMRALATSISRRGSKILLGRSLSSSSNRVLDEEPRIEPKGQAVEPQPAAQEEAEVIADAPPSPASTVGIPRRHSKLTLQERPSTIRLCSPTPTVGIGMVASAGKEDEADELPFFGKGCDIQALKERRSMAPLRGPGGFSSGMSMPPGAAGLARKSMPAMASSVSASVSSVYPELPTIPAEYAHMIGSSAAATSRPTPIPGAFPPLPPTPTRTQIIFGSGANAGVSNQQFSEAAQAVLKEMNSRLPDGGVKFGDELLKGKKAEMDKLVHVNKDLGTGGWGLSASSSSSQIKDRYADVHQKEFAKMRSLSKSSLAPKPSASRTASGSSSSSASQPVMVPLSSGSSAPKRKYDPSSSTSTLALPSAPNGAPLEESTSGRQAKRSRLSAGPGYLGSLREAGKSLAHILGEEKGTSEKSELKKMRERRDKRRSSLIKRKGTISSKFGFLRKKMTTGPEAVVPPSFLAASTSASASGSASISHPMPLQPRKASDVPGSTLATSQASRSHGQDQRERGRSTSAQTMLAQSSGRTPKRSRIPDFVPPVPERASVGSNRAALGSTNTLGLPKSSSLAKSTSTVATSAAEARAMKRRSQDFLRTARPAPPPPTPAAVEQKPSRIPSSSSARQLSSTPATPASANPNRHSTLYMPTASSLARMQATVKPSASRPLPTIPTQSSMMPPPAVPSRPAQPKSEDVEMLSGAGSPNRLPTIQPFGNASSRDNSFEANFHLPKPSPMAKAGGSTPAKTPLKKQSSANLAAARVRARSSGLSAVKSKGNVREEIDMKRRREEMKATTERRKEERELRDMLGGNF